MDKEFKMRFQEWVNKIGTHEAQSRLIHAGTSGSTALKLCNGTYKNAPNRLTIMAIEAAMKVKAS